MRRIEGEKRGGIFGEKDIRVAPNNTIGF